MAEDEQNNCDQESLEDESEECDDVIEPEVIRPVEELMALGWRIHIDERHRRIHEPTGAIPKRCGVLMSPQGLARADLTRKIKFAPQREDKKTKTMRKKQMEDLRRLVMMKSIMKRINRSRESPMQRVYLPKDKPSKQVGVHKSICHQAVGEGKDAVPSTSRIMEFPLEPSVNPPRRDDSMEWHELPSLDPDQQRLNASPNDRQSMVHFLFLVVSYNDLPFHILYQTVRIFDHVVRVRRTSPENFQLMMMLALDFILERHTIDDLSGVDEAKAMFFPQSYTDDEMESGTGEIMEALNSEFNYADPSFYLEACIAPFHDAAALTDEQIESIDDLARYMLDVALFDGTLMKASPILLAATVAEFAIALIMESESILYSASFLRECTLDVSEHLRTEDIDHHRILLMTIIIESYYCCSRSHLAYEKYSLAHYGKIAMELIQRLDKFLMQWNQ